MARRVVASLGIAAVSLLLVQAASAVAPSAVTGASTSVGARTAIVAGRVDPGGEATSWHVEYGPTVSYGLRTSARSAGNGTAAIDVTEQLRDLETGVTYHYRVVASNGSGTSRGADATFTTRSAPSVTTGAATALAPNAATLGGSVDPNGRSTGWWIEYGTSTSYGLRTDTRSAGSGTAPVAVATRVGGLKAGETYHFRLVAANDLGTVRGADKSFRTDPAPAVSTGGVDTVSVDSARLNGSVDPRGRGTVAWFEYGPTSGLGNRTPDVDAGFGTRSTRVAAPVGGLQPGTRYYYRVVARSDAGTTAGQTKTFTTSAGPLVVTGAARLSGASVVLAGTVDPVARATSWWFELGPTTAYGTSTVVRSAGSGRGAIAVSETVAGLTPGAEYHARLVARSSAGTTRGADVAFRMGAAPSIGRANAWGISLSRSKVGADVATSGLETQVWVELGRGGAFTRRTAPVVLPAAPSSARISIQLTGLVPGSRYSFRVVAANVVGTITGPSASFGTAPRPRDERGKVVRCTLVGTNGADRLVGTPRRDVICGLGGADVLIGRGADDVLVGGPGADYLVPGTGRDRVLGGVGNDFFVTRDGTTDLLFGGTGYDRARVDRRLDVVLSTSRIL